VASDQFGERDLVQVVVFAGRQSGLDRGGGLLGDLGEDVVGAQQRQGPLQVDFQWLPPTPANLAWLGLRVPAGFKQVPPNL
jgi:hypothetical protein